MENIILGSIMPHPPILIPDIGKNRIEDAGASKKALENVAKKIKELDFDTIIVITPHGEVGRASVPVYTGHIFEGSFSMFGMPKPVFNFKGDPELGLAIVKGSELASNCAETLLDHGALVPLYYPFTMGVKNPVLPVGIGFMPLTKLYEFGKNMARTIKELNRKVVIVASADMSHRLTPDAPSGYSPKGREFDKELVKLVENYDVKGILNFDEALAEEAGQDALWSIAILFGALDGMDVKQELLSYEGPFGVGYMVATFEIKN
ncbi:MAG: AmmeMemoRadiSam system protein B [Candidatus Margulisiibacteriota bacterium]|nr:AmmeMemoRadiSam system protein B [Candidatus Margulisiibacteriota bacterium]